MIDLHPEHARLVLAELPAGVILLDAEGRVTWLNDAAERLLGLARERLFGRSIELLAEASADAHPTATVVGMRHDLVCRTRPYTQGAMSGTAIVLHPRAQETNESAGDDAAGITAQGLLNRTAIKLRLEAEVSRSRRYENPLSCLAFRLPGTPGASPWIARVLKEQLRWVDLLGQWTDDVLIVVLPETTAQAAAVLAHKLGGALAECAPTIGRASWRRGDDAERLVARALSACAGEGDGQPSSGWWG